MTRQSKSRTPPAWLMPGAQWISWVFLTALVLNIVALVLRIVDGDRLVDIVASFGYCVMFVGLIAMNRVARRKRQPNQPARENAR